VLTSGFLSPDSGSSNNVMSILGSPSALPRTLVIHHTSDGCKFTLPAGVEPFIKWAGGRARVNWLSGGAEQGDPCQARGHHGFAGRAGGRLPIIVCNDCASDLWRGGLVDRIRAG
jgi:hypothetical protein